VIQVKGRGANIVVDDAELNAGNGILLQLMENDDPNKAGGRDRAHEDGAENGPQGGPPSGGGPGGPGGESFSSDVVATFSNMVLEGDIVNSMTARGNVIVTIQDAAITGAVTTAACRPKVDIYGATLSRETCQYIGEVANTYCATGEAYGMQLTLENAIWTVGQTSWLNRLTILENAYIKAPEGRRVKMTVDGVETEIKPGTYEGQIKMAVL
jgi:hypothetical protein